MRFYKPPTKNPITKPKVQSLEKTLRPSAIHLTSLRERVHTLDLPFGSFNPGMATWDGHEYILVYRPNEESFAAVRLNQKLEIISKPFEFDLTNCADPRLVWHGKNLLMTWSSTDKVGVHLEYISAG